MCVCELLPPPPPLPLLYYNSHRVPRLLCSWLKGEHGPSSWPCHHRRSWPRPWRRSSCRPSWAASAQHRGESQQRSVHSAPTEAMECGELWLGSIPRQRQARGAATLSRKWAAPSLGQHVARLPEWRLGLHAAAGLPRPPEPRPKPAVCRQGHQAGRPTTGGDAAFAMEGRTWVGCVTRGGRNSQRLAARRFSREKPNKLTN